MRCIHAEPAPSDTNREYSAEVHPDSHLKGVPRSTSGSRRGDSREDIPESWKRGLGACRKLCKFEMVEGLHAPWQVGRSFRSGGTNVPLLPPVTGSDRLHLLPPTPCHVHPHDPSLASSSSITRLSAVLESFSLFTIIGIEAAANSDDTLQLLTPLSPSSYPPPLRTIPSSLLDV